MKTIYLSAILVHFAIFSFAQINESDTARFQLRTGATGYYEKGNVDELILKTRLEFTVSSVTDLVFKSQNNSLYQEFYKSEADNDIYSRNYLYFRPSSKVYPFAIGYVSTNYRRKIDLRYFTGAGATWQLINKPKNVIKLSGSVVYEATRFKDTAYNYPEYNGDKNINLLRGTVYLAGWHYLLQNHLKLYYDAYWQPAFNNSSNYRTQFDVGLDFPIWKGLAFNMLYSYTHENVVVSKIKQDDKILTFGLSYNLVVKRN